jgi:hypothetical protein
LTLHDRGGTRVVTRVFGYLKSDQTQMSQGLYFDGNLAIAVRSDDVGAYTARLSTMEYLQVDSIPLAQGRKALRRVMQKGGKGEKQRYPWLPFSPSLVSRSAL